MAAELAAAEARLASSQDVAHLRTAGEWWDVTTIVHMVAAASASLSPCCGPVQSRTSRQWRSLTCLTCSV